MVKQRVVKEIENPFSTGEDFAALFEKTAANTPQEGEVVQGKILKIENDTVIIDIGFKTEGRVPVKDFPPSERDIIKENDTVEVFLERIENSKGEAMISRERAIREESWGKLEKLYEKEEQVQGTIFGRVKGGFTVEIEGTVAFLPGSQVDVRPVKDVTPLMNVKQPFVILKMDRKRGNIVVSRRAILEETRSEERQQALSGINEGMVLEGVVKNITDYGAFIDLGAVDGLLHVTDISWKRITHPAEVLTMGQSINVKVIKFDKDTQRISLGLKQLEDSPWQEAESTYAIGTRHKGHVTNITDYGAFVEIIPGIEGLVHVSEMSWTKKNVHPNKILNLSEEVDVEVLSIDPAKQRLSLGIKQCQENPWEVFANKYKNGDVLDVTVKSIADFGLFVGLEADADGLVHISDIAWNNTEEALKSYNKGDIIKVKILDIEPEKERIALGIKQLDDRPETSSSYSKGKVNTFTVTEVNENGIEVAVEDDKKAFIKKSDLAKDRIECRPERFSVGDRVDAKIIGTDNKTGLPKLSIKALEVDAEKQAIAEYGSADSGATLGNILGVALESAKEEAAKSDSKKKEEEPAKKATEDKTEEKPKAATKKAPAKTSTKAKKVDS